MGMRYDTATISKLEVDKTTGFLKAHNVAIARAGVFPYLKPNGTVQMEAKLPADILGDTAILSANNKPITDDHPKGTDGNFIPVNANNASELMKGFTTNNAHVDGDKVRADLVITDSDLIKTIQDAQNGKHELSIGFNAKTIPQKGEYNGMKYDAIQTDIEVNHLAVVDTAREGHEISLLGDSADDALMVDANYKGGNAMNKDDKNKQGANNAPADNNSNNSSNANSSNNSNDKQKQIDDLKAKIADLQDQLKKLQGNADDSKANADKAQAKADSLEAELTDLKKKYEGDAFDKAVANFAKVVETAKPILGDSYDFNGKTEKDIKKAVIKMVDDSLDVTDDQAINACYQMAINGRGSGVVGYAGFSGDSVDTVAKNRQRMDNLYYINQEKLNK